MIKSFAKNLLLLLLLSSAWTLFAQNNTGQDGVLTNQAVIEMTNAGLAPGIIIARIQASRTSFDLSTDGLIHLSQAGVTEDVIRAMFLKRCAGCADSGAQAAPVSNDPTMPHAPGIYVYDTSGGEPKLTLLEPTAYSRTRSSGELASTVTLGIAKVRAHAVLNGARAAMRLHNAQPIFYFYFEQKGPRLSCRYFCGNSAPHEFTLLRFEEKSDSRETLIAKYNIVGSSHGVSSKAAVPFTFENVKPGIYKVTLQAPLQPGEYCFFSNGPYQYHDRLYDFGVDAQ